MGKNTAGNKTTFEKTYCYSIIVSNVSRMICLLNSTMIYMDLGTKVDRNRDRKTVNFDYIQVLSQLTWFN